MFYFKACTKCRGDLILDRDSYGDFLKCMQCGTLIDVDVKSQGPKSRFNKAGARAVGKVKAKTAVAA